jgi:hypothetical protein
MAYKRSTSGAKTELKRKASGAEAERGQERTERERDDALARAREDKVNDGLKVGATIKRCKTKLRRARGARV